MPAAAGAAAIGALALFWFARRQRGSAAPLIDFSLFDNRGFRVAVLAALVSAFSVIGLSLVMSQRLQLVLGYSPLHAALFLLPSSVLAFIGGPLSGWLTPRYGANGVMAGALLLAGFGVAGLFLSANAGLVPQLLCLALFGLGAGAALAAASDAIMSYAPPERAGMAASIEEVSIELGGAMGITLLGSILAGVYSAILVLPKGAVLPSTVREGIDQALVVAQSLPADVARLADPRRTPGIRRRLFHRACRQCRPADRRSRHGVAGAGNTACPTGWESGCAIARHAVMIPNGLP